jgi:ketosteroid isomerase-like protein
MTKDQIKAIVRSAYQSRIRGDLEGTLAGFADDAVFEFNGRGTGLPGMTAPVVGIAALRPVMQGLIAAFRFTDWEEVSLIVDGDEAVLYWRATVTAPNGRSARFDVVDLMTFRDGKIKTLHQHTDTAAVVSVVAE